ncbi:Tensin phosphatase C2 domain [Arabidopsis thaliana x Arabidopsis arenosa]|uniref:Formin-like protein n=1 Tax=Arabidopsis thaliana x Arabidopsis arenosa TaxID=1240361 RepID=A0A8T2FST1_9BRAS|nr:Tensin phosphatase C2 domain [Arabidopsis thaliana x Arabidopsis arenosa]
MLEDEDYRVYVSRIMSQLREQFPGASFMVFNFRDGDSRSRMESVLTEYDMTIMDYPRHYEGCPLLTMETVHHFLKSAESWLLLSQQNILLSHCELGGWPTLAFMLASLLLYRKQFSGEHRTLEMIYKQAPRELLQLMSPLNPLPSQLRFLQYISRRNVGSQWPPLDQALTLDCVNLRLIPDFDGEGGCRPIFRIYGQDPFMASDRTSKVLFSMPKRSKAVRQYKQADCELVKIDINCHILGDVVLECITLGSDLEREEMMFRVVFNTAFLRSNILTLNRGEIDVLWNTTDRFPKDFSAEVIFSEMGAGKKLASVDLPHMEEKDVLPMEAFAKVQEIFSEAEWLDPNSDVAVTVFNQITAANILQESLDSGSPRSPDSRSLLESALEKVKEKTKLMISENIVSSPDTSSPEKEKDTMSSHKSYADPNSILKKVDESRGLRVSVQRNVHSKIFSPRMVQSPVTSPLPNRSPTQGSPASISRFHSSPSSLGITSILHDHGSCKDEESTSSSPASPSISFLPTLHPLTSSQPKKASPQCPQSPTPVHSNGPPSAEAAVTSSPLPPLKPLRILSRPPPPPPPPPPPISSLRSTPSPSSTSNSIATQGPPPPPPPPPLQSHRSALSSSPLPPPLPPKKLLATTNPPPPPPPPLHSNSRMGAPTSSLVLKSPPVPPPPAPAPLSRSHNGNIPPVPGPPLGLKGRGILQNLKGQGQTRKANLKPYHWLKLTRAVQGSLWAEAQKSDEAATAPDFDISELEKLFSAVNLSSDSENNGGKSGRRARPKVEKVQLIELRRAYNCEIMLSKVKIPLPDLMSSVLALDESVIDVDQVDNLIKFCPTKEEAELLKGFTGNKETLGRCEQFFLELLKVPRVETKLRVFSFKIQFHSQVTDLRRGLNTIHSAANEVRGSAKLKRIMQTILSLGNALNHGTARETLVLFKNLNSLLHFFLYISSLLTGSAIGFRLDSLLKLTDTRSRNSKMTLMHYLCKVLAEKLPELLNFPKDLVSLEAATKIQLKYLAEEMQAISKGLEKVVQEFTASETDGQISKHFRMNLKEFLSVAEGEVRSLASLYSTVGGSADALALYFGEDPARVPFEQVVSTLQNFVRIFVRSHEENCKQVEFEKKRAQKEAENEKLKKGVYNEN